MSVTAEYYDFPKTLVSESPNSHQGNLYVYFDEYRGQRLFHIRTWYVDRQDGRQKPSKKGICIPMNKIPALLEAIKAELEKDQEAMAALQEKAASSP